MSRQDDNETGPSRVGPEELDRQLQEYVDGTLTGRERGELEDRLERDEGLRAELEAYRALDATLADDLDREVPGVDYEGMREEILAAVERKVIMQGPSAARVLRWPRVAAALAAAAVVVVALSVWLTTTTDPGTDAGQEQASVAMVHPAPPEKGEEVASVSLARPEWDQVVLSPQALETDGQGNLPSGTVLLSVGEEEAAPAGMEYPILVH
jgi:anti-sigma factor RsiW